MIKPLLIGSALLVFMFNIAFAESLTKTAEGIYVSEESREQIAMSPGQRLVINSASSLGGELILRTGAQQCDYVYKKRLKTPTRGEAAKYAEVISIEAEKQKNTTILSLRAPVPAPWSGTNNSGHLKIHINIPENCAVEINTAYFDIMATGPFIEFVVAESLSKVQVDKVIGLVDIKVSNRPLIISNISGKLTATNKYDRLRLENIATGDELGTVRNEHGEIVIEGYQGGLDARTSYDRIVGQNLYLTGSKNRVKNISALINLSLDSLTAGKLRVNNQYESITLEIKNRVEAEFICKTSEEGVVTADHMEIIPTLVDENRLEFKSGAGTAEVRLTARGGGNIKIDGPNRTDIAGGNK
jgi:hypothetical protein